MSTRVQVATRIFNEPVPGVLVNTNLGDCIFVFDITTGIMGIHAPDDMVMSNVVALVEMINIEYTEKGINPFERDDTVPLIVETDMIFKRLGEG